MRGILTVCIHSFLTFWIPCHPYQELTFCLTVGTARLNWRCVVITCTERCLNHGGSKPLISRANAWANFMNTVWQFSLLSKKNHVVPVSAMYTEFVLCTVTCFCWATLCLAMLCSYMLYRVGLNSVHCETFSAELYNHCRAEAVCNFCGGKTNLISLFWIFSIITNFVRKLTESKASVKLWV